MLGGEDQGHETAEGGFEEGSHADAEHVRVQSAGMLGGEDQGFALSSSISKQSSYAISLYMCFEGF